MAKQNKVPNFLKMATDLKKNASRYAASESVKFFKDSFVKGGFTDNSFSPWAKSNSPLSGKRTLYKSGTLMQAIRKKEQTESRITIIADSEYAEIHNNGGEITVTNQMKRFFWAKHIEFKKRNKQKADYCKGMALKQVGSKIKIHERKFIGESKAMMDLFENFFKGQVNVVFKQHLNG